MWEFEPDYGPNVSSLPHGLENVNLGGLELPKSIKISRSKSNAAVSAEVNARLMPAFIDYVKAVDARVNAAIDAENSFKKAQSAIAEAFGITASQGNKLFGSLSNGIKYKYSVGSEACNSLTLESMTAEQSVKLANFLKTL